MLSAQDIHKTWEEFWTAKQHKHLQEVSLIASQKSSSALFNIAGMQQLIPYLSGQQHPLGERLYNIQPCVRINDLDEVGDNSHFTSFFMMGNRSLGNYFKHQAVGRSYEFLVDVLHIDPRKLAVTVYTGDDIVAADDETAGYWEKKGIPADKISYLDATDNRRSPGPVGPCGPCTEIYYRVGEGEFPQEHNNVKENEDNRLEIRNNVFMEYYRDTEGNLTTLKKQNVDTGMGFERIVKVLQDVESPYETELFFPVIQAIEEVEKINYIDHRESLRVIVDHLRTSCFLIAEGLIPSNEGRGYVLRKLIRAMYFEYRSLVSHTDYIIALENKLLPQSIVLFQKIYASLFPNLTKLPSETIIQTLIKEIQQFDRTLSHGEKVLLGYIDALSGDKKISGSEAFKLYDTFGFPFELTQKIANKHGVAVDEKTFEQAIEKAKELSRADTASHQSKSIDRSVHTSNIPPTTFIGYDNNESESKLLKKIDIEDYQVMVFDTTPFYATRGGQIHDNGEITIDETSYKVFDVQDYNGIYLHFVKQTS